MDKTTIMKTIRLKQINKVDKEYVINLGNGTSNSFSSKREAESFLFYTNLFLSAKLKELHRLHCEANNCYHQNWFYFDNDRKTPKSSLKQIERRCVSNFASINELLNISVERCGFTNGNYFVFIHFLKIADYLEDTIRLLAEMYGKHSNTNAIGDMDAMCKYVMFATNELNNYGKFAKTQTFKIPTHISADKSYVPEFPQLRVA